MDGQSRDTGNIGYKIQNEVGRNKNTTQEAKKLNHKDPTQNICTINA